MNIKRMISFCLTMVICISALVFPAKAAEVNEFTTEKLYAFGLLDEALNDLSSPVTRIEMVNYVVGLYGMGTYPEQNTPYNDVTAENKYSGEVNFAHAHGIISTAYLFHPDRTVKYQEAVKMIVSALNYGDIAEQMGGYPDGYINVAYNIGLLDDVNAGEDNGLTLLTVVQLLENALNVKICNQTYVKDASGELKSYYEKLNDSETVLAKHFNITKYKAFISEVTPSQIKAEIIKIDKNYISDAYSVGDKASFTVTEKMPDCDCLYTEAYIYVNDKDEILYIETDKKTQIITGYIHEVNESDNIAPYAPGAIETIAFEDGEEYLDVSSQCKIVINSKEADYNNLYSVVGSFARAVIYDNEILSLQLWNLQEGGIITKVDDTFIEYIKGEMPKASISDINSYDNVSIYINGVKSEKWAMVPDSFFDWYATEDKKELIISVSTRIITEEFNSFTNNDLRIGAEFYPLSKLYDVYYSSNGELYTKSKDTDGLLGRMVNVYLDTAGYVRYIRPAKDDSISEFYALIIGYEQSGLSNMKFMLYSFENNEAVKHVYEISDNLLKTQESLINNIVEDCTKINNASAGNKNTEIMDAELVYKVKLNDKNVITSIRPANKFAETILNQKWAKGENGFTVSEFTTSTSAYIGTPRIYFNNSKICVCYYTEEYGILVKLIDWEVLRSKKATGLWLTPYSEENSSEIDVLMIRGGVDSLEYRSDYRLSGLCTSVMKGYDPVNENEVLNVTINGNNYIVSKYKDMFKDVTNAAFIVYSTGNPFMAENEIKPTSIVNLSGSPDSWEITGSIGDGKVNEGLFKDEVLKVDNRRVFFQSGPIWYMSDDAQVFQIVETNGVVKHIRKTRADITSGAEAWYIYDNGEIKAMFFR